MTGEASRAELRLRLEQQEIMAEFARFSLRSNALQPVLDEACRQAAKGLKCEFAAVLEYRPADDGFCVRAAVSGGSATDDRPAVAEWFAGQGSRRGMSVPITAPDFRFGMLEVGGSGRRDLDGSDTPFLQTLADLIAMAVARQRHIDRQTGSGGDGGGAAILAEAELRMLEIHHRVKNSLQLVQSLLLLQGRATLDKKASADLVESAARIRTIAAIHDRLYRLGSSSSTVTVASYLEGLVEDLRAGMISTAQDRRIVLVADRAVWPVEDLSTLGLVLTELVTNAIKHGTGLIAVTFHQPTGSNGVLTVCDQGQLPADLDPGRSSGFGMRLIRTVLQGDGARLEIDRDRGGSCFVCRMPLTRRTAPAAPLFI